MTPPTETRLFDAGLQDYVPAWQAMQRFTEARSDTTADEIWLMQHPPVYTLGLNGQPEHILNAGNIPVVQIDRGGQITYHGPGQLLMYTLLDIRRLGLGVRQLVMMMEQAVIDLLAGYDIEAHGRRDAPGVYVGDAKIAALGLRVRKGRCFHGLAFNVAMDKSPFEGINPCGYARLPIAQLSDFVDKALNISALGRDLAGLLCNNPGFAAPALQAGLPELLKPDHG